MARQESGTMARCSTCTGQFKIRTADGTKLVTGTECPTCEASSRVMALMNKIRDRGEALDARTNPGQVI